MAKPVPDGYHTVTPYLICHEAGRAIDYYKKAFGAVELFRLDAPDGRIGHAELRIGDSPIMLADEYPEMNALSPKTIGNTSVGLLLYLPNCDAVYNQAVAAGAEVVRPLANQPYGDRNGTVVDPFGHKWTIATHLEDVSPEEIERRMATAKTAQG